MDLDDEYATSQQQQQQQQKSHQNPITDELVVVQIEENIIKTWYSGDWAINWCRFGSENVYLFFSVHRRPVQQKKKKINIKGERKEI